MNNDYNGFERKGSDMGEVTPPEGPSVKAEGTGFSNGPMNESAATSHQENTVDTNGTVNEGFAKKEETASEYHYAGDQMGEHGKERFTGTDTPQYNRDPYAERSSYTYRGPYGGAAQDNRDPYDRQNMYGNPYTEQNRNGTGTSQPYGAQNGSFQGQWAQYGGYAPYENNKKKEKKQRSGGVPGWVFAVVCTLCVLLSATAGIGGAALYLQSGQSSGSAPVSNGGTAVIDRVVESDGTTSTGEKGVYTDVAAAVKDSVVEITTEFKVTGFFQYVSEGAGSGVIISEDGYVITNNHVISDSQSGDVADTITVRLTNGNEYKAELVGRDADSDIAVIKINPDEKLVNAVFGDSDKLAVGEEVLAVGNPLGELGGTVTNGIISALDREIEVDGISMNLLQTNAAINPGNSGGGLFNMKGELIGVVNAKSSGSGIEGLGFAIPSNDAHEVAKQLMENGYVTGKVYLGVSFADIDDPYTAYRYFKSQSTGVYVLELEKNYNDGVLKTGDRIAAIDGDEITSFSQIKDILKEHEVGDKLKFTVHRGGKLTEVQVTCYEYVPDKEGSVDFDD